MRLLRRRHSSDDSASDAVPAPRLSRYVIVALGAIAVSACLPFLWGRADVAAYSAWYRGAVDGRRLDRAIVPVDLVTSAAAGRKAVLAALLERFAITSERDPRFLQRPAAIVIDTTMETGFGSPSDFTRLQKAIAAVRSRHIALYAAVDPLQYNSRSGDIDPNFALQLSAPVYGEMCATGHTSFYMSDDGLVAYDPTIGFRNASGDRAELSALPLLVTAGCEHAFGADWSGMPAIPVPLGSHADFAKALLVFDGTRDLPAAPFEQRAAYVVAGSQSGDVNPTGRSGLEILAWALSDRIAPDLSAYRTLDGVWLMLLLTGAFSLATALAFILPFERLRGRRQRLALSVAAGALVPLAGLAAFEALLIAARSVDFRLTLVAIGIVITDGACLAYGRSALRAEALTLHLETERADQADSYDVFISYARDPENAAWVEAHVLEPLSRARTANGAALRIFFDRDSIKVGHAWHEKIVRAIWGSRYFLPVYSKGYFARPFCREELQIAAVKRAEYPQFILPVARVLDEIPLQYRHIEYLDAASHGDFIEGIIALVTAGALPRSIDHV